MSKIYIPEWPWRLVRELAAELGVACWLVGGAVRDLLLERPVHDWDFAVDGKAMTLARRVGDAVGGAYFPLDEERGTARVVLTTERGRRLELDFALLRGDGLEADLKARDFTVNAMALEERGLLIDPLGGADDLKAQRIRATAEDVFRCDPVRLLRAPRMEAELRFRIEPETKAWIRRDAPLLRRPAAERVRDEVLRGLAVSNSAVFVRRLDELELLEPVVPELGLLKGVALSPPHRFDVWRHTLMVMDVLEHVLATLVGDGVASGSAALSDVPVGAWGDLTRSLGQYARDIRDHMSAEVCACCDRTLLLKIAALFHDVGKSETTSEDDDGIIRFFDHEVVGARMAAARLRKLRLGGIAVQRVRTVVRNHLRPGQLAREKQVTRRAIYRFYRDTGDAGVDVVLLYLADHLGTYGPKLREERWSRRLEVAQLLLHQYFEGQGETVNPELPVDGHDLMRELELESGPEIGRLLELLSEAVAAGEVKTRDEALALAREEVG